MRAAEVMAFDGHSIGVGAVGVAAELRGGCRVAPRGVSALVANHAARRRLQHMVRPLDIFLAVAKNNATQRAVSLDTGANDGMWTQGLWKKLCLSQTAIQRAERGLPPHLLVIIEPQQQFAARLKSFAENRSSNRACHVQVLNMAAWTYDGFVSFSSKRDSRAAYVGAEKRKGQLHVTQVPALDYGAFLKRTLRNDDNVFMKLDIEAGEFRLLPYMLSSGSLCNIDYMLIEWHFSVINATTRLDALGMRLALASLIEKGCPPRPSGRLRRIAHDELQLSRHHVVPGLWERARWHNGQPTLPMAWARSGVIQSQGSTAASEG